MSPGRHRHLTRQLRKLGVTDTAPPSPEAWQAFLDGINKTYEDVDRERYTLERSVALFEREMGELNAKLDARNGEMRMVLDNVDQALITVDLEGRLERQRSAALDRWFPGAAPGMHLWDVIETADPETAAWMAAGWEQLGAGILPTDVALAQLPRAMTAGGRHYQIGYRPIGDESKLERILLVITDVSELIERERREADQQEHLMIFQRVTRDGPEFEEFFNESAHLMEGAIAGRHGNGAALIRAIHTIKGNCGMYGITSVASVCHALESKLVDRGKDGGLDAADVNRLTEAWSAFAKRVRDLAGAPAEERVGLSRDDLRTLRMGIASGKSRAELLRFILESEREPVDHRLSRMADQAGRLARRLGKGEVKVTTESNQVRLDGKRWAPFWAAFVHVLCNALDHGIEAPEERLALGKPDAGRLALRIGRAEGRVMVEISDDGRGIDWVAVRAKALQRGMMAGTDDELLALLFRGGLSTKSTVTEYSGRGFGLSACYNACRELGGTVSAISKRGHGSTFRFSIPDDDSVRSGPTSAVTDLSA